MSSEYQIKSVLTCPACQFSREEIMPKNACQWFYVCTNCHKKLKPMKGDCCVYCSYGTHKCPPVQFNQKRC